MSPRERRLWADRREIEELAARTGGLRFASEGEPPDRYVFAFEAEGLERRPDGSPRRRREHEFACYLHLDYPRQAPLVVWQTPIFHPNILGPQRHGAVCLGSWSASESLADLCDRVMAMAAWRSFNLTDALDFEAAEWASARGLSAGCSLEEVLAHA